LVEGRNVIQIKFRNRYNNDGYGLSKIKDRDGEEYIYSNCEPCGMHTIFPCFDLIFVRAIFTLTIICDKNFKAISNEILLNSYDFNNSVTKFNVGPETKSKEINYKIHHFHETKPIPEYIFTFACGNYFEIKNNTTFEGCPKLPSSLYIK
jgi:aminopeptidase N